MDEQLADRLRTAIGELSRAVLAGVDDGAPLAHIETLGFLVREGGMSVAVLARRRRVRHQSQSAIVVELERDGLVRRDADPRDHRSAVIAATPAGHALIDHSRRVRSEWLAAASARLDDRDLAVLERVPAILLALAHPDDVAS